MKLSQIHNRLLQWYQLSGRHSLPWRNTTNLYHIYLSEIMLQQTQVNRVESEYFPKFLQKFPTMKILANATLDDVLSAWSGLGYYRRAKHLHASAQITQGKIPQDVKELIKLPGIGKYTASAICSFGLSQSVPVVDTNIARVLKRYFALLNPKDSILWEYAKNFLNIQHSREHNLALMDLGSMVCLPKNAKCSICPLSISCKGQKEFELYTQKKKTLYIPMELYLGVYIKNNKIALKISQDNMYKDMLVLPDVDPIEENFIGTFKHSYTKYKLTVKLYHIEELNQDFIWVALKDFDNSPISSLTKKAKEIIEENKQ